MKFVLYLLMLIGATLLGFDLAKEVKKIEKEPAPEPTKPVRPQTSSSAPAEGHNHAHSEAIKRLQQQLTDATAAIEKDPKNATAYLQRAELHTQLNQPEKALADVNQAAAITPDNAEVYFQRGYVYIASGKVDQAIADFSRVLEIEPSHTKARLYRAIIRYRQSEYQLALDDCLDLLKHEPTFYDAHLTASRCYFELKNKTKAVEHLETYIANSKDVEGIAEARRLIELWKQEPAEQATPSTDHE